MPSRGKKLLTSFCFLISPVNNYKIQPKLLNDSLGQEQHAHNQNNQSRDAFGQDQSWRTRPLAKNAAGEEFEANHEKGHLETRASLPVTLN